VHAWLCENPVGVDALTWKELPTPAPKAGEVLIEIKAASLNFPDLLIVQNKYQMKPPLPFVPGAEYAGVVAAVGEGVKHLKRGPERRLPVGHRRLRHPHHRQGRAVHAPAARRSRTKMPPPSS
jgi:NADPH:quinone reductase-like Zn-dependent oxidoreductase